MCGCGFGRLGLVFRLVLVFRYVFLYYLFCLRDFNMVIFGEEIFFIDSIFVYSIDRILIEIFFIDSIFIV